HTKTIKTPGTTVVRVAQACDRCRAKKTKCDGQNPCSSCSAIGIECIVSDKLSRRAFPKGYTETLEERVRQLEAENKKLTGLLDIRDEQLEFLNSARNDDKEIANNRLNEENVNQIDHSHIHDEHCSCGESNPQVMHERPVSIAGSAHNGHGRAMSVDSINLSDDESILSNEDFTSSLVPVQSRDFNFGRQANPAPHAFAAATAIAQMQKGKDEDEISKQQKLTSLVAISIPRSTEETLFIPTLIARICQAHGYNSKPAVLTAHAIASLKENNELKTTQNKQLMDIIMNRDDMSQLSSSEALVFIRDLIDFPTSRMDLDHLVTVYFQDWGLALPILDKNAFLKNYMRWTSIVDNSSPVMDEINEPLEKFGAMMVLVLSLSMLSNKYKYMSGSSTGSGDVFDKYLHYLAHFDKLIHEFIKPNCIITNNCSMQSLKILSLCLQYCLVIGDINTCYELRGRVITMAHQLRLHRCPSAVLAISGGDVKLQKSMQSERRLLFWCVYCLDVYSSLNLGVPRLLKDFEIECALPFAGKYDDDDQEGESILIINNKRLSIVGKVKKFALAMMLYCKVLGNNLDSIFSRYENSDPHRKALHRDGLLDSWRRELPSELKFDIDINGFSLKDGDTYLDGEFWKKYSKEQLTLIFLYYHAKILIYLPVISKYGNHHNVGLSPKEQILKAETDAGSIASSISMIQQSSLQILEVLKSLTKYNSSYLLPIPVNIAREQARFTLLVAKGSLDYMKGGPLYQTLKQLLLDTIASLNLETSHEIPGSLTKNSVKLLEFAILGILGLNLKGTAIKKKSPPLPQQPINKPAVLRDPLGQEKFKPTTPSKLAVEVDSRSNSSFENDDGLENILNFDPFDLTTNRQRFMNDFAADGSLGLVPFLGLSND
ncbi:uncharacterized protein CANTADRAFT_36789, partial [Suhomyces tanzawaensis NRRL Y-17324]